MALASVKKANSEANTLPRISSGAERRRSCVEKTHRSPLPHPTIIDAHQDEYETLQQADNHESRSAHKVAEEDGKAK